MTIIPILPLYIDPGTGSMLFSILVGLLATAYFLGRALLIKLKFIFAGKKNEQNVLYTKDDPYVIYNEGEQYITLFSGIIQEFEKRQTPLLYLTSAENDPALSQNFLYVKTEYIGSGNSAFMKLNMLSAKIVLMTTPGLDVYQLKRSKGVNHYSHLVHMTSDATTYRLFGLDYFDSVLLTGDYQSKDLKTLERIRKTKQKEYVTVGCPYLDILEKKIKELPKEENHPYTVLVSPSWGESAILSRFGEKLLEPLSKTGYRIIVRPHPQSKKSESEILDRLMTAYPENENFIWDFEKDNILSLSHADIMISDFSGIIFDYMFLCDKPFLYVNDKLDLRPYDAYDIIEANPETTLWQFETLKKTGRKLEEKDFCNIGIILKSMSDNEELAKQRAIAKNTAWMHRGEAASLVVDFMMSKNEDI
ncbi:MAG: CDP-glycerol glycerophosphotransferase family protein [Spirochaetaceae bacterium]|nr:CDP-glycerol glycerophosphotransferase family protein [Spirochaetaceae bacterium]